MMLAHIDRPTLENPGGARVPWLHTKAGGIRVNSILKETT